MVKTRNVSVSVYEIILSSGRDVKVQAVFCLDGLKIERDEMGALKPGSKILLQKALEDALTKWEFE